MQGNGPVLAFWLGFGYTHLGRSPFSCLGLGQIQVY